MLASSRVRTAAGTSFNPVAFFPAHNGEKSPLPWLSAAARKGAMADAASGKAGARELMGPSSLMTRFTIPLAGRPVNRLVNAVMRELLLLRIARCTALVVASGHRR